MLRELPGRFAFFTLVALTIGMTIYHWLLMNGLIPPFLAGYRGAVSTAVSAPALLLLLLYFLQDNARFTRADVLFLAVMMMMLLVAFLQLADDYFGIIQKNLAAALYCFAMYYVFRILAIGRNTVYFLLGLSTVLLLSLGLGDVGSDAWLARQGQSVEAANYQDLAIPYLLIWLLAVSVTAGPLRTVVYAVGLITLFYNGARSEMIAIAVAIIISEIVRSRGNTLLILGGGGLALFFYTEISGWIIETFPTNRFALLLRDMSGDQSWQMREAFSNDTWDIIRENPVFGDYAAYSGGEYAHSIIGAWADFGVFGFALFLICIVVPLWTAFLSVRARETDPLALLLAMGSVTGALLFAFAKFYEYPLLGVNLALAGRYLQRKTRRNPPQEGLGLGGAASEVRRPLPS